MFLKKILETSDKNNGDSLTNNCFQANLSHICTMLSMTNKKCDQILAKLKRCVHNLSINSTSWNKNLILKDRISLHYQANNNKGSILSRFLELASLSSVSDIYSNLEQIDLFVLPKQSALQQQERNNLNWFIITIEENKSPKIFIRIRVGIAVVLFVRVNFCSKKSSSSVMLTALGYSLLRSFDLLLSINY